MDKPGFITKIHQSLHDDSHWLTRRKLVIFGITLVLTGLLLGLFESGDEPEPVRRPDVIELPIPERDVPSESEGTGEGETVGALTAPLEDDWVRVKVRRGQTLDSIFRSQKIPVTLLHQILALNADTKSLKKIR
jgi:hypothetical protein